MSGSQPVQFFVAEGFARRSRWVIMLLLANWLILGLVLGSTMKTNPAFAIAAAIAGVLTMAAGAGQLRAARYSEQEPIAEITEELFRVRYYSSKVFRKVALDRLVAVEREGGVLALVGHDGERQAVPLRGLSEEDRQRLVQELGAAIASRGSA